MKTKVNIVIAEDHPIFCEGLLNALARYPEFVVMDVVKRGDEVLNKVTSLQPDVLILDINLPQKNGIQILQVLKNQISDIKVLILSMYHPIDLKINPKHDFFHGFVSKSSDWDVLILALNEVLSDRFYWDPNVQLNEPVKDVFISQLKLSARELEILELLRQGLNNKEISEHLHLSELTVKTHRKNIMFKTESKNLADLLRKF
jgi:DNA-binding NarL/FixJ family response regulator